MMQTIDNNLIIRHAIRATGILAMVLACCLSGKTRATQIQLSPSVLVDQTPLWVGPEIRRSTDYYNLRLGSLSLALSGEMSVGYDDNVAAAPTNEEESFYFVPSLTLSADWPVSPMLQITSDVEIGYRYYTEDEAEEGFYVNAGSLGTAAQIEARILPSESSVIAIGDRYFFENQSLDFQARGDLSEYSLHTNETYVQYDAQLNPYFDGIVRYEHILQRVDDDEFEVYDLDRDALDLAVLWDMNRSLNVGPYVRYERVVYKEDLHNDSDEYGTGLTFSYEQETGIVVTGHLGYTKVDFDTENFPAADDDYSGLDAGMQANFATSERTSHVLSGYYGPRQGQLTEDINYAKEMQVQYALTYALTADIILGGDVAWRKIDESDNGENADLYRFGLQTSYLLSPASYLTLSYGHTEKNSDDAFRDYDRNTIEMSFGYKF